ncbi:CvpA family protein [Oceanobacillus halotolerans]|uniref:CvpA family protein n=1 Tax=Oceanobacillus halotolerans TaxID=2663380 RepID=UPI0013DC73FA|nr:CvpA family protein [Oceanobacillus halotolerans]
MVDFILIILLILGFFIGLKRGFILQVFHLLGFIIAFILATIYYDNLAEMFSLWIPYPELGSDSAWAIFLQSDPLETAFYNAIAFAAIFFSVKIVLQIIASMLDFVASLPILSSINGILGAVLGFLEVYLIIFVILFILALTPISSIQVWIDHSTVAQFIVEKTPILSEQVKTLWFTQLESMFDA